MFRTKFFSAGDIERGLLDTWLDSLNTKQHGVMVVGYATFPAWSGGASELSITVKIWQRQDLATGINNLPGGRTTIDPLTEEPSIAYPDGEFPGHDEG